mgnify:CR=1 FL=1
MVKMFDQMAVLAARSIVALFVFMMLAVILLGVSWLSLMFQVNS